MNTETIVCRAQVADHCYDGKESDSVYGEVGMAGDALFDGTSVICDVCYIELGQPSVDGRSGPSTVMQACDAALAAYREARA